MYAGLHHIPASTQVTFRKLTGNLTARSQDERRILTQRQRGGISGDSWLEAC